MKSRLFSVDPESRAAKSFAATLQKALELDSANRQICLTMLRQGHSVPTDEERSRVRDQLAAVSSTKREAVESGLSVMKFLMDDFLNPETPDSDYESWADDLVELGWISGETQSGFEDIVASVQQVAADIRPELRRRQAAAGVLPILRGLGYTVEVRSVQENSYRLGIALNEYEPRVVDVTPVASIRIGFDEGPTKEVFFQADEENLDHLISTFQAAKKEMAALRRFLKLED